MSRLVRTIRYVVAIGLLTALHGGAALVAGLLRVRHRPGGVYDWAGRVWGRRLLRITGLRVSVHHRERLPTSPVVYIANHASFADIWVLLQELPGSLRFVFKREMMYIPVLGQAMRAAGHISIDRQRKGAAFTAYDRAAGQIRGGISAAVFAEGTRSRDGTLQPFKKGPFVLAIQAGVPVVPLYLGGTYAVMPSEALAPQPGAVHLLVGEPIPTAGMTYEDRDALATTCRSAILALRDYYTSTLPSPPPDEQT